MGNLKRKSTPAPNSQSQQPSNLQQSPTSFDDLLGMQDALGGGNAFAGEVLGASTDDPVEPPTLLALFRDSGMDEPEDATTKELNENVRKQAENRERQEPEINRRFRLKLALENELTFGKKPGKTSRARGRKGRQRTNTQVKPEEKFTREGPPLLPESETNGPGTAKGSQRQKGVAKPPSTTGKPTEQKQKQKLGDRRMFPLASRKGTIGVVEWSATASATVNEIVRQGTTDKKGFTLKASGPEQIRKLGGPKTREIMKDKLGYQIGARAARATLSGDIIKGLNIGIDVQLVKMLAKISTKPKITDELLSVTGWITGVVPPAWLKAIGLGRLARLAQVSITGRLTMKIRLRTLLQKYWEMVKRILLGGAAAAGILKILKEVKDRWDSEDEDSDGRDKKKKGRDGDDDDDDDDDKDKKDKDKDKRKRTRRKKSAKRQPATQSTNPRQLAQVLGLCERAEASGPTALKLVPSHLDTHTQSYLAEIIGARSQATTDAKGGLALWQLVRPWVLLIIAQYGKLGGVAGYDGKVLAKSRAWLKQADARFVRGRVDQEMSQGPDPVGPENPASEKLLAQHLLETARKAHSHLESLQANQNLVVPGWHSEGSLTLAAMHVSAGNYTTAIQTLSGSAKPHSAAGLASTLGLIVPVGLSKQLTATADLLRVVGSPLASTLVEVGRELRSATGKPGRALVALQTAEQVLKMVKGGGASNIDVATMAGQHRKTMGALGRGAAGAYLLTLLSGTLAGLQSLASTLGSAKKRARMQQVAQLVLDGQQVAKHLVLLERAYQISVSTNTWGVDPSSQAMADGMANNELKAAERSLRRYIIAVSNRYFGSKDLRKADRKNGLSSALSGIAAVGAGSGYALALKVPATGVIEGVQDVADQAALDEKIIGPGEHGREQRRHRKQAARR